MLVVREEPAKLIEAVVERNMGHDLGCIVQIATGDRRQATGDRQARQTQQRQRGRPKCLVKGLFQGFEADIGSLPELRFGHGAQFAGQHRWDALVGYWRSGPLSCFRTVSLTCGVPGEVSAFVPIPPSSFDGSPSRSDSTRITLSAEGFVVSYSFSV